MYCVFPLSLALIGDLLLLKILQVLKLSAVCYCSLTTFIWCNSISNIFSSLTNVFLAVSKSSLILKYLQIKRHFYMNCFCYCLQGIQCRLRAKYTQLNLLFCRHQNLEPDFQSAITHQSHRIAKAGEGETRLNTSYVTCIEVLKHWKDWAKTLRQKLSTI